MHLEKIQTNTMEPPCARWISPLARRLADRVSASLHVRRNPGWYIGRLEVHRVQLVILPGRQTDFHHQTAASVDDALEAIRIFWPSGSCRKARDVCLVPPRRPRHVSLPDQQDRPRPAWCVHIFAFALTIDHRPWTIDHGPWTMDHLSLCLGRSTPPHSLPHRPPSLVHQVSERTSSSCTTPLPSSVTEARARGATTYHTSGGKTDGSWRMTL